MTQNIIKVIVVIALMATILFCGYHWGKTSALKKATTIPSDTIYVYREVQAPVPEPVVIEKIRTEYIKVPYPVPGDSKTDTLSIPVPIEQKEYRDSLYRAYVSGYNPSLDSIFISTPTMYITNTVEKKYKPKFSFGLQGGFGAVIPINQKPNLGGYIGLGIQYNF